MNGETDGARFSAPWGRATWIISALVMLGVIGLTFIAVTNVKLPRIAMIALVTAPLLIIAATLPFIVLGYEIRDRTLIVNRLGWATRIPLAGLRDAEADPKAMSGSIRIVGNGGLFAFTGIFWSRQHGRYRAYVTDFSRSVILTLADRTIVVSPGAPDRFLAHLRDQRLFQAP